MKLTNEIAEEIGKELGKAVKAAMRKATDQMEAQLLSLESRVNQLEAQTAEKAQRKGKR